MLRRDSSFKISKQTKRTMAGISDKASRDVYREHMIRAQIDGSKVIASKKGKDADNEG